MDRLNVICGIGSGIEDKNLFLKICVLAKQKGKQLEFKICKSKLEVEHSVYVSKWNTVVLLQEMLEVEAPYQAWEIATLRDIQNCSIVPSVQKNHYGTQFLTILYAAGIQDAIFEDDANVERITERILFRRGRKECRKYYGIRTVEETLSVLEIIEKETLERYLWHISSSCDGKETLERYLNIQKRLNFIENSYLIKHLPETVIEEIKEDANLEQFKEMQVENKRKKILWKK